MIAGRDSSFTVPSDAQLAVAYAAGVRAWGGYLVSDPDPVVLSFRSRRQGMYGLAAPWVQSEFDRVRRAGMVAIGFCSGRDSAAAVGAKGRAWGVLPCVDAEPGIRADGEGGNWIPGWVRDAGSGLYGLASVHHHTGEPLGRGAAFNLVARYPGGDPRATWDPAAGPRPPGLCGWQWRGTTPEFGVSTDSLWLDDGFAAGAVAVRPAAGDGGGMSNQRRIPDPNSEAGLFHVVLAEDRRVYWGLHVGGEGAEEASDQVNPLPPDPGGTPVTLVPGTMDVFLRQYKGVWRLTISGRRESDDRVWEIVMHAQSPWEPLSRWAPLALNVRVAVGVPGPKGDPGVDSSVKVAAALRQAADSLG